MTFASPKRIQRKRTKGWRLPPNTVAVTRPGRFGNPYRIRDAREAGYTGTDEQLAQWCVDLFRKAVLAKGTGEYSNNVPSIDEIKTLRGKNLACWCKGAPCHADVLIELANEGAT